MSSPADELVDVVDDHDVVVRTATRAEVRADDLLHRAVFVALTTSDGQVWVHQRAAWKDVWPSRWDVAFGGVVDAGEGWEDAARRELAEEAGVSGVALVERGRGRFDADGVRELARVYEAVHDGAVHAADGEVAVLGQVRRADLRAWAQQRSLVPDSAALVLPMLTSTAGPPT